MLPLAQARALEVTSAVHGAQEGDAAAMDAFGKTFDGIHFKKGLPLCFCIHKDTLTSKVGDFPTKTFAPNGFLCRLSRLLPMYIATKSPVVVGRNLPKL